MISKSFALLFAFFSVAYAAPTVREINVLSIAGEVSPAPTVSPLPASRRITKIAELSRQEMTNMSISSTESGFGRITQVGISVTRGATATASYDITVTAVDAETLDRNDESFVETLTEEQRAEFLELKESFDGGLNVPVLEAVGADLSQESLSREEILEASGSEENFERRSNALSQILESVSDTTIRINGTLTATGLSDVPTVAFAFIRLARIEFDDGSSQLVVSNRNDDIIAADGDGVPVGTSDRNADVVCNSGFFC